MGTPKLDRMGDHLQRGDLSTFQYFTRNLLVGSAIEGAVRAFGLVTSSPIGPQNDDVLTLKRLPKLPDFNFIPGANAASTSDGDSGIASKVNGVVNNRAKSNGSPKASHQDNGSPKASHQDNGSPKVSHQDNGSPKVSLQDNGTPESSHQDNGTPNAQEIPTVGSEPSEESTILKPSEESTILPEGNQATASTGTSEGYFAKVSGQVSDLKDRAMEIGPVKSSLNYISENREWLLITGSVIGIASAVNYLASKKIRNCLVRNVVSLGVGVGATWVGYNYGLGLELDMTKTADIANRVFCLHGMLRLAQPLAYRSIGLAATTVSIAAKPLAFPQKRNKVD